MNCFIWLWAVSERVAWIQDRELFTISRKVFSFFYSALLLFNILYLFALCCYVSKALLPRALLEHASQHYTESHCKISWTSMVLREQYDRTRAVSRSRTHKHLNRCENVAKIFRKAFKLCQMNVLCAMSTRSAVCMRTPRKISAQTFCTKFKSCVCVCVGLISWIWIALTRTK